MLASSTRREEKREEVSHGFWKTGGLPSTEQGFVEVKPVRTVTSMKKNRIFLFFLFFPLFTLVPGLLSTSQSPVCRAPVWSGAVGEELCREPAGDGLGKQKQEGLCSFEMN